MMKKENMITNETIEILNNKIDMAKEFQMSLLCELDDLRRLDPNNAEFQKGFEAAAASLRILDQIANF